jgi:hypothetical protein
MAQLTVEERRLAAAIDAMEKVRALAVTDGDLIKQAEIDEWFRVNRAVIRALRDKLEGEWD